MLDSTVELISLVASNSLFVFCFCNLIIAIILMGSKSSSDLDDGSRAVITVPTCTSNTDESPTKAESPSNCREERPVVEPEEVPAHCNIQIEDEGCVGEEDEGCDHEDGDEDDDELRTRIEDFIAKVNREWQDEKLKAIEFRSWPIRC